MTNHSPRGSTTKFHLPDIPQEKWCDIRRDYSGQQLTLKALAEKYGCDPRTIKACLIHNKPSTSIGQKSTPTRIDLCRNELPALLEKCLDTLPDEIRSTYQLSCYLLPIMKEHGYTGSERTLRNYLHLHPAVKALFEKAGK